MKQYTFVLNFGYVESSQLSYFPFSSTKKHHDAKVALLDLANFLKEQYLLTNSTKPKKCCLSTKEKDSEAEFCSKCGHAIREEEFDDEHFMGWLRDMSTCDIDSLGEYIEWDDNHSWQSNGLEGALNQRFVYHAEWVIAAALGYPHRDRTFEDICSDRTKSKQDSFSYYN